jgi:hypothetical protein
MRPATNQEHEVTIKDLALADAIAQNERDINRAHLMINRATLHIYDAQTDLEVELWFGELKAAQVNLREEVALRARLEARKAAL